MSNKIYMKKTLTINDFGKMKGYAHLYHFRSDLMMKYTDVKITETVEQEKVEFESGLRLVFLLEGRSEIHFNHTIFELDANSTPQAAFLPLNKAEWGSKVFRKTHQKELVVFIYPKWIMESQLDLSNYPQFKHHLQPYPIVVTQSMQRLIDDILSETNQLELSYTLEKESKLLALLANSFAQLHHSPQLKNERIQQVTEALDSGKFDHCHLKEIAKYFHTNVTTLQNEFQQYHKITIFAYVRRTKLEQSYKALLQGYSVMQAAELAGYSNSENFSTAFKRLFGITPRQIKRDKSRGTI